MLFRSAIAALFSVFLVAGAQAKEGNIVAVAKEAGTFQTLLTAAEAAGVAETLTGEGPFTVFAPNDEAFAKLPKEKLDALLKPENKDKLAGILKYHVVPGKLTASELNGKQLSVKTAQGAEAKLDFTKGARINDAGIVKADIQASNGVIHVINSVILPPEG